LCAAWGARCTVKKIAGFMATSVLLHCPGNSYGDKDEKA
jgi:hypothetical protein